MSTRIVPQRTLVDINLTLFNLFLVSNFLHLCLRNNLVVTVVHIGHVIAIFFIRIRDQFELIADSILRIFDEILALNCDALVDPIPSRTSTMPIPAAAADAASLNSNLRPPCVAADTTHRWGLLRGNGAERQGREDNGGCFLLMMKLSYIYLYCCSYYFCHSSLLKISISRKISILCNYN